MIDDIRAEEERNSRIVFDYQNQRRSTGVKNQINDERSRRDAHYRLFHWLTIATDCNWLKLKPFLVESWIGCQCFENLAAVDWFAQVSYRSRGPMWTVHVQLSHLTIVFRITRCLRRTHVTRRSTATMIDAILQSTASNSSSEFKISFFFSVMF